MQTPTQYASHQLALSRHVALGVSWQGYGWYLTAGGSLASHRPYRTRQEADRAVAEVLRVARHGVRGRLMRAA